MNLRYYVRQKAVDTGIEKTIHKEPENFWYKNNGILMKQVHGNIYENM